MKALRQSQREQEKPSQIFKSSQRLQKEAQSQHKQTYQAWLNWVLRDDGIVISDLETQLKDGIALIKLAQRMTGKTIKRYSKKPRTIHQKRENIGIALTLFKKNGFSKQVSGVAEEDFEKDENDNTDRIDAVPVLGFLWQLMMIYQRKNFKELDPSISTKGLTKEQKFLLKLQQFISTNYDDSVFLVSSDSAEKLERNKDGVYELESGKVYVAVSKINVAGDKQIPIVYARVSKNSDEQDVKEAKVFVNKINNELGNTVNSVLKEGDESDRFKAFLAGEKEPTSKVTGRYKIKDTDDLEVEDIAEGTDIVKDDQLMIEGDQVFLVRTEDGEGLFAQGTDRPIKDVFGLQNKFEKELKGGAATLFTSENAVEQFTKAFGASEEPQLQPMLSSTPQLVEMSIPEQLEQIGGIEGEEELLEGGETVYSANTNIPEIQLDDEVLEKEEEKFRQEQEEKERLKREQEESERLKREQEQKERLKREQEENDKLKKQEALKKDQQKVQQPTRLKLPIKSKFEYGEFRTESGVSGQDFIHYYNSRFVRLWYGFTDLDASTFLQNPEACKWTNSKGEFYHEAQVESYFEDGISNDIFVDVPSGKNVVFRARFANANGFEFETRVFFVAPN